MESEGLFNQLKELWVYPLRADFRTGLLHADE